MEIKKNWPTPRIKNIIDQISRKHPTIFGDKENLSTPRIEQIIDQISRKHPTIFVNLEITHDYQQIPIDPSIQDLLTFIINHDLNKRKHLPKGIKNDGQDFQKTISTEVLHNLSQEIVITYIDDMHIATKTEDEL